jgi:hypothetical protein
MSDLPTKHENYSHMKLSTSEEDVNTMFKYHEDYDAGKNYGEHGPTKDNAGSPDYERRAAHRDAHIRNNTYRGWSK